MTSDEISGIDCLAQHYPDANSWTVSKHLHHKRVGPGKFETTSRFIASVHLKSEQRLHGESQLGYLAAAHQLIDSHKNAA